MVEEIRVVIGSGNVVWWEKDGVDLTRRPRELFDVRYPRQRKGDGRERRKPDRREGLNLSLYYLSRFCIHLNFHQYHIYGAPRCTKLHRAKNLQGSVALRLPPELCTILHTPRFTDGVPIVRHRCTMSKVRPENDGAIHRSLGHLLEIPVMSCNLQISPRLLNFASIPGKTH